MTVRVEALEVKRRSSLGPHNRGKSQEAVHSWRNRLGPWHRKQFRSTFAHRCGSTCDGRLEIAEERREREERGAVAARELPEALEHMEVGLMAERAERAATPAVRARMAAGSEETRELAALTPTPPRRLQWPTGK